MPTTTEGATDLIETYYNAGTWHVRLTEGDPVTSEQDLIANEPVQEFGYSAQSVTLSGVTPSGVFGSGKALTDALVATFSSPNPGEDYTADRFFTVRGMTNAAIANIQITAVDPATDTFTANSHGFSNGDRVLVTADAGGTLPTEASAADLSAVWSYIGDATANTFKLYSDVGLTALRDISTAGSGTLRLRNATGAITWYKATAEPFVVIGGGSGQPVSVQFSQGNIT